MSDLVLRERPSDFGPNDAGNTSATATAIPFRTTVNGRVGDGADTDDWYRFTAPVTGFLTVRLTGLTADLSLVVRDSALKLLGLSSRFGTADEVVSSAFVLGGETILVHVDPFLVAASDYQLSFSFVTPPDNGTLRLDVFNESFTLLSAANATATATAHIDVTVSPGRVYYIAARAVGGTASDYALTSSFVDAALANGEGQDRAGNTIATATPIDLPQTVTASVGFGADSADVYRIVPPNTGSLIVQLNGLSQDADLYVFGSSGLQLGRSENSNTSNEQVQIGVTGGAAYYVEVRPFDGARTFYSLTVDMQGSTFSDAGNSFDTAQYRLMDQDIVGNVGFGSDTGDFVKFVALADGTFTARMSGHTADLDLYLYDGQGNRLAAPFLSGTAAETITRTVTAGSVYYLRVAPFQGSASSYSVDLSFQATGNAVNTAIDGNDFWSSAPLVSFPLNRVDSTGFGSDIYDYFRFTANATGTLTVDLTGLNDDLDLEFLRGNGSTLATSSKPGTSNERVIVQVTAGSEYLVGVLNYRGSRSTYRLATTFEPAGTDADGARETARWVVGSATITDKIGFGGDAADFYRVVASASGFLFIEMSGLKADIDLELYDANGVLIVDSLNEGRADEDIVQYVKAGETYFLKVVPYLSAVSTYTLDIDVVVPVDGAGNTRASAFLTQLPGHYIGLVGEGDDTVDLFTFVAPVGGDLALRLEPLTANADLRLLDASGSEIAASRVDGIGVDRITQTLAAGSRYYVEVTPAGGTVALYEIFLGFQDVTSLAAAKPTDPFFANQWHVFNTGQTGGTFGVDLNVVGVWSEYTGRGVNVGVYDSGVEYTHPDLAVNFVARNAVQAAFGLHDPFVSGAAAEAHGTAVAGIIAADNNGVGVVGVAFDSSFGAVRWLGSNRGFDQSEAFSSQSIYDVVNHSWGYTQAFAGNAARGGDIADIIAGLESAARNGRGGRGTVMVFAAGNDREEGIDANYSNLSNSPYVITVAAADHNGDISSYSSPGASILVAAFGGNYFDPQGDTITTTDLRGTAGFNGPRLYPAASLGDGDYTQAMNGTSSAAPMVSGVAALMLQANPDLGYRDVQAIMAATATLTGGGGLSEKYDWAINCAATWNGGGYHFSHDYGFGLVDARAAVRLAETWFGSRGAPPAGRVAAESYVQLFERIAPTTVGNTTTVEFTPTTSLITTRTELKVSLNNRNISDVRIVLRSPGGTESYLFDGTNLALVGFGGVQEFTFTSNAFWGESSAGKWTLMVTDPSGSSASVVDSLVVAFHAAPGNAADNTYVFTDEFALMKEYEASRGLIDDPGGHDALNLSAVSSAVRVDLSSGNGTIVGASLTLSSRTVIEEVFGGDGDDTITGALAGEYLHGGRGNDTIAGAAGNDTLVGGPGNDVLTGGADTIVQFDRDGTQGTGYQLATVMTLTGVTPAQLGPVEQWILTQQVSA